MRNLLSIDFDFFVREDPMWDFGHSEDNSIFLKVAWMTRYSTEDLYKETSIGTYADFKPVDILKHLARLGFRFKDPFLFRFADSHKYAFDTLRELGGEVAVYNFDAHHDLWQDKPSTLDCGNWIYRGIHQGMVKHLDWIAPSWSEPFNADEDYWFNHGQHPEIQGHYFNQLKTGQFNITKIDAVFLCRSGCWVPPHHDQQFVELLKVFLRKTKHIEELQSLIKRDFPTPVQARKMLKGMREMIKKHIPATSIPT